LKLLLCALSEEAHVLLLLLGQLVGKLTKQHQQHILNWQKQ
jgi:hypothetical protein